MNPLNRRHILKSGTAATLAAGLPHIAKAQNIPDKIKIGLIGCGGRGNGAIHQALSADPNTVLWAIGDAFGEGVERGMKAVQPFAKQIECTPERRFVGLDAYQQVIDSGVDLVILATPPGFRPQHLRAAVDAGKHSFVEKPMAVDVPGLKSVLESTKIAKQKNLTIQHGFCWRFHPGTREAYGKVLSGELGKVRSIYGTYMANPVKPLSGGQPEGMPDIEWQLRNWMNFEWLSAGPLVEQCIHTVDKVAWAMGDIAPIAAVANGGRAQKTDDSNIYDHYNVVYEYPEGVTAHVGQRHFIGCHSEVKDRVVCQNGTMIAPGRCSTTDLSGKTTWRSRPEPGQEQNMYQVCHNELFAALRKGEVINTGEYMVNSTALGIFGREAAHCGQRITWEDFWKSVNDQAPDDFAMDGTFPVTPPRIPGTYKI